MSIGTLRVCLNSCVSSIGTMPDTVGEPTEAPTMGEDILLADALAEANLNDMDMQPEDTGKIAG